MDHVGRSVAIRRRGRFGTSGRVAVADGVAHWISHDEPAR